jgi:glycosyltransferase involved in cell wall biosynthesis
MPDLFLLTDRWHPDGGGRERYAAELSRWLAVNGWEVVVVCAVRDARAVDSPGVTVESLAPGNAMVRFDEYVRRLRQSHPGVPVLALRPILGASHYQLHSGVLADAFAGERDSFGTVVRRAMYWPALRANRRRVDLLATEADVLRSPRSRLMVFSEGLRRRLQAEGVDGSRVTVSRPGIDLSIFHPAGLAPTSDAARLRLVFAGHNFLLKGLATAVEALAILRDRGVTASLSVAGRGAKGRFLRLARNLGLNGAVTFEGDVSQSRLAELFRSADVAVHPAYYDPFPRALLEALACGCAVVTTRACGVSDLVERQGVGIVVDEAGQAEQLADALVALSNGAALQRARERTRPIGPTLGFEEHAKAVTAWLGLPAVGPWRTPSGVAP